MIKAYQPLFWLNRFIKGIKPKTDEIYRNNNNQIKQDNYQNEKIPKFLEILKSFNGENSEKDLNTVKNCIKNDFMSLKINTQELKSLKENLDEIRKIFDRTRDREFFNELCFEAIELYCQNYLDLLIGIKENEIKEFNKVCRKLYEFEKNFQNFSK